MVRQGYSSITMKLHNKKTIDTLKLHNRLLWCFLTLFLIWSVGSYVEAHRLISPCPDTGCHVAVVYADETKVDELVDIYSFRYGKTRYERNRIKALLHFLLLKEQNYGGSDSCGDHGLACGPLQYHQATYESFRKIMMKKGFVKTMGSRLNMKDAIETTAWAISDGREGNWGPVARKEIIL